MKRRSFLSKLLLAIPAAALATELNFASTLLNDTSFNKEYFDKALIIKVNGKKYWYWQSEYIKMTEFAKKQEEKIRQFYMVS